MVLTGFAGKRGTCGTHSASLIPQEFGETAKVLSQPREGCERERRHGLRSWQSPGVTAHALEEEEQKISYIPWSTVVQLRMWFHR